MDLCLTVSTKVYIDKPVFEHCFFIFTNLLFLRKNLNDIFSEGSYILVSMLHWAL